MWTRKELKSRGLAAIKANYWKSVVAAIVVGLAGGGVGGGSRVYTEEESILDNVHLTPHQARLLMTVAGILLVASVIMIVLKILVFNALEVGGNRFFLMNLYEKASLGELGYAFQTSWFNCVKILFLRDLKIFLWSMLFVIPGIVKAYEYRMLPFILAEDPYISSKEAFARSRQIMDGQKMDSFVLDFSFFGWILLSGITMGLLSLFFVNPYTISTRAAQYDHYRSAERREEEMFVQNVDFYGRPYEENNEF